LIVRIRQLVLILLTSVLVLAFLSWDLILSTIRGTPAPAATSTTAASSTASNDASVVTRGAAVFGAQCVECHGPASEWPIAQLLKRRTSQELYALLDHLPAVNPAMPGFRGGDEDRRALAAYLGHLSGQTVQTR
jgi:mono/diheme cytochrome c family protein